jgi:hypothetical protein
LPRELPDIGKLLPIGSEKARQRPPSFGHKRDGWRRGSPLTYRTSKVSLLRTPRGDHFLSHKQEGWTNKGKLFELIDLVGTVIYAILSE